MYVVGNKTKWNNIIYDKMNDNRKLEMELKGDFGKVKLSLDFYSMA